MVDSVDVGSGLQVVGGLLEAGSLIWAYKKVNIELRQYRWEDAKAELDTDVEVLAKVVTQGPQAARDAVTRSHGERIHAIYEVLYDVFQSPVKLFVSGVLVNLLGVVLAAGWL